MCHCRQSPIPGRGGRCVVAGSHHGKCDGIRRSGGLLSNQHRPLFDQSVELLLTRCHRVQRQFLFLHFFEVSDGGVGHLDDVGLRLQQFFLVGVGPPVERRGGFSTALICIHATNFSSFFIPATFGNWCQVRRAERSAEVSAVGFTLFSWRISSAAT